MINKKLIFIVASSTALILMFFAIFLVTRPSLNLTTNIAGGLDKITVNGKELNFKNNMSLSYSSKLEISASKEGYITGKWTLDPKIQKSKSFNLSLQKSPGDDSANIKALDNIKTDTTQASSDGQDKLLLTAKQNGQSGLLDFGSALNVNIIKYQALEDGIYFGYIITPKIGSGDPGLLIIKKIDNNYVILLGPGTDFSSTMLIGQPASVINFIKDNGYYAQD